jgi:mxaJ protein
MSSRFPERVVLAAALALAAAGAPARELRVCAHPDNLPFSNAAGRGFENRIAEVVARDLGATVAYTWIFPPRGLVRKTLGEGRCDVLAGVPSGLDRVEATRPYYRSTYVFVSRSEPPLASFDDPRIARVVIGVELPGDDLAITPAAHALMSRGAVSNVRGFPVVGEGPVAGRLVSSIASGELDAAVAWGPSAAYFAAIASSPLHVEIAHAPTGEPMPFEYAIAMATRRGDRALRDEIDAALERRRQEIDAILDEYHVPRVAGATS